MHSLSELEKHQVGLRLPKYLINEIDEFTQRYDLNRSDIIIESIKSYLSQQEIEEFYNSFDKSCKELKKVLDNPKKSEELQTLDDLLDEL